MDDKKRLTKLGAKMERLTVHTAKGLKLKKGRKFVELLSDKEMTLKALNHLAELEDKLEDGQLVELPKFGDTYWYIYSGGVPEAVTVTRIEVEINQSETRIYAYGRAVGGLVGMIMFPTYEQAEARLKEIKERGE